MSDEGLWYLDDGNQQGVMPRQIHAVVLRYRDRETNRMKRAVWAFQSKASADRQEQVVRKYQGETEVIDISRYVTALSWEDVTVVEEVSAA